ncbi:MAG: DUF3365 domain-containing protein [Verrucomicrobiales bacterium]|nr:DUF3365 domain-containing protein [Verrucomicrobiales bacterium]
MKPLSISTVGICLFFFAFPFGTEILEGEESKSTASKDAEAKAKQKSKVSIPKSAEEARGRARWMHEAIHGALQVMHRDFFGDGDDGDFPLPSQSLDDVFVEMSRTWNVDIRWLGVNATKGKDHHPRDRFEEAAAQALMEGSTEYEKVSEDRYRYVGVVHIRNECLKCHDRSRTTLDEKVAGLAFSFPLQTSP